MNRRQPRLLPHTLIACCLAVLVGVLALPTPGIAANESGADKPVPSLLELRESAIRIIQAAARDEDPFLRANAIEAMQSVPSRALPLAQIGLDDEHPVVRFTSLVTIGKMRLLELGRCVPRKTRTPLSVPLRCTPHSVVISKSISVRWLRCLPARTPRSAATWSCCLG